MGGVAPRAVGEEMGPSPVVFEGQSVSRSPVLAGVRYGGVPQIRSALPGYGDSA